jgi:hypothetical protein
MQAMQVHVHAPQKQAHHRPQQAKQLLKERQHSSWGMPKLPSCSLASSLRCSRFWTLAVALLRPPKRPDSSAMGCTATLLLVPCSGTCLLLLLLDKE